MFAQRGIAIALLALALGIGALSTARPSSSAGEETAYVVRPGDTLWEIAAARYDGDPREAIWRIRERNDLAGSALTPGTTLALPPP